jgi:nucleoside-triphosphatase THEP1
MEGLNADSPWKKLLDEANVATLDHRHRRLSTHGSATEETRQDRSRVGFQRRDLDLWGASPLTAEMVRPQLRLERVHVRALRGLGKLTLPEDGLAWGARGIPDLVVLGGPNGSGKTTLLRCLVHTARSLVSLSSGIPTELAGEEILLDFCIRDGETPGETVVGPSARCASHDAGRAGRPSHRDDAEPLPLRDGGAGHASVARS